MITFTPRQQTTVASALTFLAALSLAAGVLGALWLCAHLLAVFSGVILPVATAGIAALVLKPVYGWLRTHLRLSPLLAVLVLYALIVVPACLCLLFLTSIALTQIGELLRAVPGWLESLGARIEDRYPQLLAFWQERNMNQRVSDFLQTHWSTLLAWLGPAASTAVLAGMSVFQALVRLLSWVVLPIYLAFFLMAEMPRPETIDANLPFLKPDTRQNVIYLGREFVGILVTFFRGQLLIALSQGILFAVGFELVGLKYGWILGLLTGMLNLVPYLGSMLALMGVLPTAFLQTGGGWARLASVIAVIVVVQCIEGYVLTPRIMGRATGLHPAVIIFSVFFWGAAFGGILGMIMAIPLTAFLVVFWRLLKSRYIWEVV